MLKTNTKTRTLIWQQDSCMQLLLCLQETTWEVRFHTGTRQEKKVLVNIEFGLSIAYFWHFNFLLSSCEGRRERRETGSARSACAWQYSAILLWRIQDQRSPPVTSVLAVDVATTYHPVRPLRTQHRRWRGIRNWWVLVLKTNLATCHD